MRTELKTGWIPAALPENERDRLNKLRGYAILDTLPEESFDRITRLASSILKHLLHLFH